MMRVGLFLGISWLLFLMILVLLSATGNYELEDAQIPIFPALIAFAMAYPISTMLRRTISARRSQRLKADASGS